MDVARTVVFFFCWSIAGFMYWTLRRAKANGAIEVWRTREVVYRESDPSRFDLLVRDRHFEVWACVIGPFLFFLI